MRERSETIYAQNESAFHSILQQVDSRRQARVEHPGRTLNEDSDDSDSEDNLGCCCHYSIQAYPKSYKELAEDEEDILYSNLKANQQKKEFFQPHRSFSECLKNVPEKKFERKRRSFMTHQPSTPSTLSLSEEDEGESYSFDPSLINENLANYDEIIKMIFIGKEKIGKSYLASKLTSYKDSSVIYDEKKYTHTQSLEIKNIYTSLNRKLIKIETFDTNNVITSSPMISTFYSIVNCYVLVVSRDDPSSIDYVEKEVNKILSVKKKVSILLFINSLSSEVSDFEERLEVFLNSFYFRSCKIFTVRKCINKFDKNDIEYTNFIKYVIENRNSEK